MTTTTRHRIALSSGVVAALLTLTVGCSEVEDAARDATGDAACSVARAAAEEAQRQATSAADRIAADPQAAEAELRAVRDAVQAAEGQVSDDTRARLADVRTELDGLVGEAADAAEGAPVDEAAVEQSKEDLTAAVAAVGDVCSG